MTVIENIKEKMVEKRYKAKHLAIGIGMTDNGISNLFKRGDMKLSILKKIAVFLETPISYFIETGDDATYNQYKNNNIIILSENVGLKEKIKDYKKEVRDLKEKIKLLEENNILKEELKKYKQQDYPKNGTSYKLVSNKISKPEEPYISMLVH